MAIQSLQAESAATNPAASIPALFDRWAASVRAYTLHPGDGDDADWRALHEASEDARRDLLAQQANTTEELALKTHAVLHHEYGETLGRPLDFDRQGGTMTDTGPLDALAADLVRLSPRISQAVATAL